jgi:hypothetical protein
MSKLLFFELSGTLILEKLLSLKSISLSLFNFSIILLCVICVCGNGGSALVSVFITELHPGVEKLSKLTFESTASSVILQSIKEIV